MGAGNLEDRRGREVASRGKGEAVDSLDLVSKEEKKKVEKASTLKFKRGRETEIGICNLLLNTIPCVHTCTCNGS